MDSWQSILAVVAAILIAYAVVLWLGTLVWAYRDIRERTRDSWSHLVSLLIVVLFNLPGLVLYLVLRPRETLMEAYERRLETEALLRELPEDRGVCPRCSRVVRDEFLLCPYCRTGLREPCTGCGRALELSWAACPYCGAQGPQAIASAPPSMAPGASPFSTAVSPPAPSQAVSPPATGTPRPSTTSNPSP